VRPPGAAKTLGPRGAGSAGPLPQPALRQKGMSEAMMKTCQTGRYCCRRAPPTRRARGLGDLLAHFYEFHPILDYQRKGPHNMKPLQRIILSALAALAVMLLPIAQVVAQQQRRF
jgi:hypothetical protein